MKSSVYFVFIVTTGLSFIASVLLTVVSAVQHSIELRIIVDRLAIDSWKMRVHVSLSQQERATEAKRQMEQFIRSTIVGANAIFGELVTSGISLDVRIASLEFIEDETISDKTEFGSNQDDHSQILEDLRSWLSNKAYSPTDHTVLLTGMALPRGPGLKVAGVSYRDKICTESSLSAVAARPNGNTAIALVHELSHSLNAAHDGAEDNGCSNSSKFIMASVGPRNVGESYRFSLCSISYIKNKLLSLYSDPGGNCLAADKTRTVPVVAEPLGKLYTPDEICQMNVARDSYLCRAAYGSDGTLNYSSVCTGFYCASLDNGTVKCGDFMVGADGLVCGDRKECSLGVCRPSAGAPSVSDNCPFGDPPASAVLTDDGKTCRELVSVLDARFCYANPRHCCGSCEKVRTAATPDCEYGDKAEWCADPATDYPYMCGNGRNADVCCSWGSCGQHYNASRVGCEYGDKAEWCPAQFATSPAMCGSSNNRNVCCESCAGYVPTHRANSQPLPQGCEDVAVNCYELRDKPWSCYSANSQTLCCETCLRLATGVAGCEYGDKSSGCADLNYPYTCYTNEAVCCASCLPLKDTSLPKGCEYGDKSPGCGGLNYPFTCYTNEAVCCRSCLTRKDTSKPRGCQYGDKATGCDSPSLDCTLNAEACCDTCATLYRP